MRSILCNIINPVSEQEAVFLSRQIVTIEGQQITGICAYDPDVHKDYDDYSHLLALPGFIDLHVHLSQYRMRGLYEPSLLPWLTEHVFPEEARSQDETYAQALAKQFFQALGRAGTTTSLIYTAPFYNACDIAFQVAEELGIKASIGMTMMDQNSPSALMQSTAKVLEDSFKLYERWHGKHPHLDYVFTPRFAPTCSMELMRETAAYAQANKAWIQTHLSENTAELAWVQQLFGLNSYTEVYRQAGMLGPRSIFGHAIHLQDKELAILKEHVAKIAHCPDSNFYLKSGEFPLQRIEEAGIEYGLGSDVGAGTSLNMLYHAKMLNYRQSSNPVLPAKALYHITLGSAKLLGKEASIGSLNMGKDADIVFLCPPEGYLASPSSLSQLCFFGEEFQVRETLAAGRTIYRNEQV